MKQVRSFDLFSIILHWSSAILIFILFPLGLYMVELSYYDSWYKGSTELHKSLGLCFILLLVVRVLWRIRVSRLVSCEFKKDKNWESNLAYVVQMLMYISMILLAVSGYMVSTAGGREVMFFEWLPLPPLWMEFEQQEEFAGKAHLYMSWLLIGLICLHFLSAIKHHFIDRDEVLIRILKPVTIKRGK